MPGAEAAHQLRVLQAFLGIRILSHLLLRAVLAQCFESILFDSGPGLKFLFLENPNLAGPGF